MTGVAAGPQQRGVECAAAKRNEGGRAAEHPGRAGVLVRHPAGEQAHVDRGAQPDHLVGSLLLVPVGGRDQPPGRPGLHGERARCATGPPAARRAGEHDPLHQLMRPDDADRELALGAARRRHNRPGLIVASVVAKPGQVPPIPLITRATLHPISGRLPAA